MVVSPLNALILDQVSLLAISQVKKHKNKEIGWSTTTKIPTIAVCSETLAELGTDAVYKVKYQLLGLPKFGSIQFFKDFVEPRTGL